MAQKIIQMQMRHLYFNLKDLFSNRKGFVILTSLLRFKNKSREFREYVNKMNWTVPPALQTFTITLSLLELSEAHHISFQLNRFSVNYRFPFPILRFLP